MIFMAIFGSIIVEVYTIFDGGGLKKVYGF